MSARRELYAALMKGGAHSPDRSERASALIDTFAHELAEKQRETTVFDFGGGGCYCGCYRCEACEVTKVIDSIDPAKEGDRD